MDNTGLRTTPVGPAKSIKRPEIRPNMLVSGVIYFKRYLIVSRIAEQGSMSTTYRAIDLAAAKNLNLFELSKFGLAKLKTVDLEKLDNGAIAPGKIGLHPRLSGAADALRECKVVLKCAEGHFVRLLEHEAVVMRDLTPEENSVSSREQRFPRLIEFQPIPDALPDSEGIRPHFIAMSDVGEMSLDKFVQNYKITLFQAIDIARQMMIALKMAHETKSANNHHRGYVLGDLNPSNVILRVEKDNILVRIADFGTAAETGRPVEESQMVCVNNLYGSPEALKLRSVDKKSDFYAWGLILYSILAWGINPKDGDDDIETHLNHLLEQTPDLPKSAIDDRFESGIAENLRPVLDRIYTVLNSLIKGATRIESAERFHSHDEIIKALEEIRELARQIESDEVYETLHYRFFNIDLSLVDQSKTA